MARGEARVAASPETMKKYTGLGYSVMVEKGAGLASLLPDDAYEMAGAGIVVRSDAAGKADIVLKVHRPARHEADACRKGAVVFAMFNPYGAEGDMVALAKAGLTGFSMEFMPRISRTQVMDVLSFQVNLAGYQAIIDSAGVYGQAVPMMMTAAGIVPAARVFIMRARVTGLQAIATACRFGAVVTGPRMSVRRQRSRLPHWGQDLLLSKMRSSALLKPQAVMPEKCRRSIRQGRQS